MTACEGSRSRLDRVRPSLRAPYVTRQRRTPRRAARGCPLQGSPRRRHQSTDPRRSPRSRRRPTRRRRSSAQATRMRTVARSDCSRPTVAIRHSPRSSPAQDPLTVPSPSGLAPVGGPSVKPESAPLDNSAFQSATADSSCAPISKAPSAAYRASRAAAKLAAARISVFMTMARDPPMADRRTRDMSAITSVIGGSDFAAIHRSRFRGPRAALPRRRVPAAVAQTHVHA